MSCPGPFHFSYSVDYNYDFCPHPDTDVGLSIFVCDVEHWSVRPQVCSVLVWSVSGSLHHNVIAGSTHALYTCLFRQTPLLILIVSLSLRRCTATELSVYMSFRISMYTSSIPCSCNDVNIAWVCTESNAFSQYTKSTHGGMLYSRHFSLSWFMACMWYVVEYLLRNHASYFGWFSSSYFSSLVVIMFVNSLYYLIASKLACSSWCLFCSLSWKISPYLLPSMF